MKAVRLAASLLLLLACRGLAQVETPSDAEVLQHMMNLSSGDYDVQVSSAEWLSGLNDISVVPAFLDAMYLVDFHNDLGWILEQITGQKFRRSWPKWMEWLGTQEFEPHPAYPFFKQRLFQQIDPAFAAFLNPGLTSRIRLDEIVWGGVQKDGIPAIDDPRMVIPERATYLNDDDEVFGLEVNGAYQAFPLRILNWHEMVNTTIGGRPLSLTYCTLCGAAVPYFTAVDSTTYSFGTSGLLYRSNKLMYDRQTGRLWTSVLGRPVLGKLAGTSIELEATYVVRMTWKAWRELHPSTRVLSDETGFERPYGDDSAYKRYFRSEQTMFPVAVRSERLKAKAWVFGVTRDTLARAWTVEALSRQRVLNDWFGEIGVVIILTGDEKTAVRAYERGGVAFRKLDHRGALLDDGGNRWRVEEDMLVNESGESFQRVAGHMAYWFAWYAFHPQTSLWEN